MKSAAAAPSQAAAGDSKATLTCFRAGDNGQAQEYYKVVWSDVYISTYKVHGHETGDGGHPPLGSSCADA